MRTTNEETLLYLIDRYFKNLEKAEDIIKYLFEHTELFEKKYMTDYPHELYRFFSGKLGTYAKQRNKLLNLLDKNQLKKLKLLEILE